MHKPKLNPEPVEGQNRARQTIKWQGTVYGTLECRNPDEWTDWVVYNNDRRVVAHYEHEYEAIAAINMAYTIKETMPLLTALEKQEPKETAAERRMMLHDQETGLVYTIQAVEQPDGEIQMKLTVAGESAPWYQEYSAQELTALLFRGQIQFAD